MSHSLAHYQLLTTIVIPLLLPYQLSPPFVGWWLPSLKLLFVLIGLGSTNVITHALLFSSCDMCALPFLSRLLFTQPQQLLPLWLISWSMPLTISTTSLIAPAIIHLQPCVVDLNECRLCLGHPNLYLWLVPLTFLLLIYMVGQSSDFLSPPANSTPITPWRQPYHPLCNWQRCSQLALVVAGWDINIVDHPIDPPTNFIFYLFIHFKLWRLKENDPFFKTILFSRSTDLLQRQKNYAHMIMALMIQYESNTCNSESNFILSSNYDTMLVFRTWNIPFNS